MNKFLTKTLYIVSLGLIVALGSLFYKPEQNLVAQTCTADTTSGNLSGYILATNITGPIYVSSDSWNADPLGYNNPPSPVDFFVSYDRNLGIWSGRAWHEDFGWINFDTHTLEKMAIVEHAANNQVAWGSWSGLVDMTDVNYSNQLGTFNGFGVSGESVSGSYVADVGVGFGQLDFSNVDYQESPCDATVDLFLNDTRSLHRVNCPVSAPRIKWTSENVNNCETVEGFWNSPGNRNTSNTGGEQASAGLPNNGEPQAQLFRLRCIRNGSSQEVYGAAVMSCGTAVAPTAEELIKPVFIEV